jgi:uncharacterized radical SAM superfamily Fe-S cluster-containing enzyme
MLVMFGSAAMDRALCDTTRRDINPRTVRILSYWIVQFMDRFNFRVGGVKQSCIHFVTPHGQMIPFDTYNLFYRNDRIDGIRAAMQAEMRS